MFDSVLIFSLKKIRYGTCFITGTIIGFGTFTGTGTGYGFATGTCFGTCTIYGFGTYNNNNNWEKKIIINIISL
ncbi:hypothetical protein BLA29_013755, partial [Euroglyphus maynei]